MTRKLRLAIRILSSGGLLPVDLHARLIEAGYDVRELERIYAPD